jgi:hypothetical protein
MKIGVLLSIMIAYSILLVACVKRSKILYLSGYLMLALSYLGILLLSLIKDS